MRAYVSPKSTGLQSKIEPAKIEERRDEKKQKRCVVLKSQLFDKPATEQGAMDKECTKNT